MNEMSTFIPVLLWVVFIRGTLRSGRFVSTRNIPGFECPGQSHRMVLMPSSISSTTKSKSEVSDTSPVSTDPVT